MARGDDPKAPEYLIADIAAMDDDEYRKFLDEGFGPYEDHHGVLRIGQNGQPVAVTKRQAEILIERIKEIVPKMES